MPPCFYLTLLKWLIYIDASLVRFWCHAKLPRNQFQQFGFFTYFTSSLSDCENHKWAKLYAHLIRSKSCSIRFWFTIDLAQCVVCFVAVDFLFWFFSRNMQFCWMIRTLPLTISIGFNADTLFCVSALFNRLALAHIHSWCNRWILMRFQKQ